MLWHFCLRSPVLFKILTNGRRLTQIIAGFLYFCLFLLETRDLTVCHCMLTGPCCTIDESMIKFKGRLQIRQYLPGKPIKWGIKVRTFLLMYCLFYHSPWKIDYLLFYYSQHKLQVEEWQADKEKTPKHFWESYKYHVFHTLPYWEWD